MVIVSIEPGDIDPFGYEADDEPAKTFNYSVPKVTAESFKTIVKQVNHSNAQNGHAVSLTLIRRPNIWGFLEKVDQRRGISQAKY